MPAAGTIMSSGGASAVAYHADFFLYEPRGALDFTSDSFAAAWPHPAVVAKQYASYPITTLHYSWRHATDILDVVGAKLSTAAKLDPTEVHAPCSPTVPHSPSLSTAQPQPHSPSLPFADELHERRGHRQRAPPHDGVGPRPVRLLEPYLICHVPTHKLAAQPAAALPLAAFGFGLKH